MTTTLCIVTRTLLLTLGEASEAAFVPNIANRRMNGLLFVGDRFERPILHGLCSLGFAVRAVIRCCCGGNPESIRSVRARFLLHVFPGETLKTEMWIDGDQKR